MDRRIPVAVVVVAALLGVGAWWLSSPPELPEEIAVPAGSPPADPVVEPLPVPEVPPAPAAADGAAAAPSSEAPTVDGHEGLIADLDPEVAIHEAQQLFDDGDAVGALQLYRQIVEEHPDDRMAPFALYKLAWTEYNLGDIDGAAADMERLIAWFEQGAGQDGPHGDKLREVAESDLERFRGELEDAPGSDEAE